MRKSCLPFLTILFSLVCTRSFAQEIKPVHFSNGNYKIEKNISSKIFKKEKIKTALYDDKYFVLLQFASIPTVTEIEQLKTAGIELSDYLPANSYFASIRNDFDFLQAQKLNIIAVGVIPSAYKIDADLTSYQPSYNKEDFKCIAVNFISSIDRKTAEAELEKLGAVLITNKFEAPSSIFIEIDTKLINAIAALPFVSSVTLQTLKDKTLNYNSVAAHGVSALEAVGGKNLLGRGVTVGIGDNADMSTHIDLTNKLIMRTPWYPDDHGTHVAGTLAGAGIIDVKYHGMAPKATLINQYFTGIIINAVTYLADNNMVVTNNSYYSVDAGCTGEGKYDVLSNYIDWQLKNTPQLMHIIAAGNDGGTNCSPYSNSFATVKSGWQSAKNVLTVGAMDNSNYTIAGLSSCGPVKDGRIKPEIVSGGVNVTSTITNNNYLTTSGTSMAAPAVTGSLALLYEDYRRSNGGTNPKAALLKALLCNSAEDLGNPGPDFRFGFGMLNTKRAVEDLDSNRYFINTITNNANATHTITIPKNARKLKVMLYWSDKEAAINAATALINDLDLTVAEPGGVTIHKPLILNPSPGSVNNNAVEGADHTNNIEQVTINDPVAGTYTVNVNGYNVPYGPQDYIVAYEILDSSITLQYPYGGETWVPGESELIRWNVYGSESKTFTLEYSTDSGNVWNVINNAIANARSYTWTVPATVTNKALIRISTNGTSYSDQSKFGITILGRPVVTAFNACQGYVSLKWNSIAGATSYNILQMSGDSMMVIANTIDTNFLVKNLDKNKQYWFGVAAKKDSAAGRRSLSVNITPSGGACTATIFNGDIKVDSILEPNTARKFFANAGNAVKPVKVRIRNLGSTDVAGPITVSYNSEGGIATETITATVPAKGTYDYTFTTPYVYDTSAFHYNFKAWTTNVADSNHQNDTAYKAVKLLDNSVIASLPIIETFETSAVGEYRNPTLGFVGNDAFDFTASSVYGRARTFVNTGFSRSGTKALTLDQTPYQKNYTTSTAFASYNLSAFSGTQLRYDFYYRSQGMADSPNNRIWIRGSENDNWVEAYNLYANQPAFGQWQHGNFNINDLLNSATPSQAITPTFQIRFGEQGYTSANTPVPQSDLDDGFTFDDMTLKQVFNDLSVASILSPSKNGCGLSSANPISIRVKNYNNTAVANVPVNYQVNNGTVVTEIIPSIAANSAVDYTFTTKANLSSYVDYSINAWVKFPGDTYSINDSVKNYSLHNSPVITTYPYLQGFENNNGQFYAQGTNSTWQWGAPAKTIINKAPNGNYIWTTNLTGNYNNNEQSYLYTPCFDLSSLNQPVLSFSHILQLEQDFDFSWVEYSTDGTNWQKLGDFKQGTNWYDSATRNWRNSNTIWHVASIDIPTKGTNVRFRFVMNADDGVTYEGAGIDDFHIFDKAAVYTDTPITSLSQNVSGNNWIHFTANNKRVVSINANGNNLGITNVSVYPYNGSTRYANDQYYLNRNIVIRPTGQPSGMVAVRFYFTDSEVNRLLTDVGCANCTRPQNAYQLGVTQYNGSLADENGTLADNLTGLFSFITPDSTDIIPYDNGYYAEYDVSKFGEFWLNKGGINNDSALPLKLVSFIANKQNSKVALNWQTQSENSLDQFIIERSSDGKIFTDIGIVPATNSNLNQQYNFVDASPLVINYYRLKVADADGSVSYSAIQQVNFDNNASAIVVYPNPVTNRKLFIASSKNCTEALLLDVSGKIIRRFQLQGNNNSLNISGIAKGVYQLKIFTETSTSSQKIIVQ
ncbi:S8 family serine peptidase [Ferruginibacter albus]|uniref:S8 family serine peptidase n=1 Tax=Ferruginibacter albus TaxID=2875540 RepID=UPI001CC75041|nr:S8 family serine peptidase [Ferruginibacter albus]UAY51789.1 S8 family serine peptidase [Ferruginibacter albus]